MPIYTPTMHTNFMEHFDPANLVEACTIWDT
jgi:hypothetical protein